MKNLELIHHLLQDGLRLWVLGIERELILNFRPGVGESSLRTQNHS